MIEWLAAAAADPPPSGWAQAKLIAETLAAWFAVIGAPLGAFWLLARFGLTESNEAKLALEQMKSPSYLNTTLGIEVIEEKQGWNIMGSLAVSNPGKATLVADFTTTDPILITRLKQRDDGDFQTEDTSLGLNFTGRFNYETLTIAGGGSALLHFIAHVDTPGYYLVEFISHMHKPDGTANPQSTNSWMATRVVRVPKLPDPPDPAA